ncbi:hypothetical protein [Candidatus Magnetominusculus dajiuhuensis]|uniref:hypothetical protein n=1 Tax=Candidatus Magnetominusculus dajiuhuensis TaxID=3137712 RepID=UPI003B436A3F
MTASAIAVPGALAVVSIAGGTRYIVLLLIVLKVLLLLSLLFIPGFLLLKLIKKHYFSNDEAFLLAAPASIIVYVLIFIPLYCVKSHFIWYLIFNCAFVISVTAAAYRKKMVAEILRIGPALKYGFLMVALSSVIALSFVSVNMANPEKELNNWVAVGHRGLHDLPGDNNLQYDTATVFAQYKPPWVFPDHKWTMGDRPPLLGVLNSIIMLSLNKRPYSFWNYLIVGITLNSLFLLPLSVLAKRIFNRPAAAYLAVISVFLNVFIFINVYFTWPKLFAVFFLLTLIVYLWDRELSPTTASIGGAVCALGALSHGNVLLTLPVVILSYIAFAAIRGKKTYLLYFFVSFLILYSPWSLYKIRHPEINTSNLIGHYIPAGKHSESLYQRVSDFIQDYPIEKQLERRVAFLLGAIRENRIYETLRVLQSGDIAGYLNGVYPGVFYHPVTALGEMQVLLTIIMLIFYIIKSLYRKKATPFDIKTLAAFIFLAILSYAFNVLIKWTPPNTHELPYTELIILIAAVSGVTFSFGVALRWFSFGWIFLNFTYYVIASSLRHEFAVFDFFNIVVFMVVAAMVWLAHYFSQNL